MIRVVTEGDEAAVAPEARPGTGARVWASDLPPGVLRAAVFGALAGSEGHGYELAGRLERSGIRLETAFLYRLLRSMEGAGDVASCWVSSHQGPARRVYRLSDQGQARLGVARADVERHERLLGHLLALSDSNSAPG